MNISLVFVFTCGRESEKDGGMDGEEGTRVYPVCRHRNVSPAVKFSLPIIFFFFLFV